MSVLTDELCSAEISIVCSLVAILLSPLLGTHTRLQHCYHVRLYAYNQTRDRAILEKISEFFLFIANRYFTLLGGVPSLVYLFCTSESYSNLSVGHAPCHIIPDLYPLLVVI